METAEHVREARIRRLAKRRGYTIHRSRMRDPLGVGYGTYYIADGETERVVAGDRARYGLTMDETEKWLNENLSADVLHLRRTRS